MNAPTTPALPPTPPRYSHFVDFAEDWLFPFITLRLAEAHRENTYTWCAQWWAHRPVAVRIAHLHRAFEATRRSRSGTAFSNLVLNHIDPHLRHILDAANGPLHRCTRTQHTSTPSLPFAPVPAGWFPAAAATRTPSPGERQPKRRFGHYRYFVEDWLLPVTAVRVAANQREGQFTWCLRWWQHHAVAVRFAGLHIAFEAAATSDDHTAISTLIVRHIDPHMRYILDAANGPLHRCTPDQHTDLPGLPAAPVPGNWFTIPGASTPVHHLGFAPDFRALT
ncbi:DUF4913 domain-containing protein [Nocardia testacea]|uniref:DUF4913 domain-containing protein n=1 Tax=Nocardia testacea TaxID=248551 RepID=UPI003A8C8879